ncbi:AAA family ATPase [Jiangella alkaliphila]|uniref:AAA domain-containing protein n=1 Tax=Jiangella alkaliphila TaxID=419479 RepID=A0A1H2JIG3_9ACTN|nr:AAA family ATPase [Jiangella alkaliphila]SDU56163.1 AAA domain-containing protein [Jiangella alkaliphila]
MNLLDRRPVRRVEFDPTADPPLDLDRWPWTLPPVRQLVSGGLDLPPLTVLVGENGSGKSTLVEGVALAYGFSPEGGSTGAQHSTRVSESELWRGALVATHSPLVASLPGATVLEVGEWGLRETAWADLDLVRHWRAFLDAPARYLRHVT